MLVIIATLVALAWPNYSKIREKALNREAKASLALIRAAEKIYKLEQGFYYPYSGSPKSAVSEINDNLKLSLPDITTWTISVDGEAGSKVATRTRSGGPDARVWSHPFANEDSTCSGGSNCP